MEARKQRAREEERGAAYDPASVYNYILNNYKFVFYVRNCLLFLSNALFFLRFCVARFNLESVTSFTLNTCAASPQEKSIQDK